MLRTRLATAALAIPLLVWVIVWNPWSLFTWLVAGATMIGVSEYFAMAFPNDRLDRVFGLAAGALMVAAVLTADAGLATMVLSGVVVAGMVLALARNDDLRWRIEALGLTVLGLLYAALLLPHYAWMHALGGAGAEGWRWVVLTLVVAMAGDVGGYFGGRYLGRRKLMPSVSPGKTVEGSVAAAGANLAGGVFCKLVFFHALGWGEAMGIALAAGALAQVGDLCESMLKRAFGAKDSGWIIPGHGGVLDRIDSLVFPAPFVYYYARFFFGY